jgi:hypothetical protein
MIINIYDSFDANIPNKRNALGNPQITNFVALQGCLNIQRDRLKDTKQNWIQTLLNAN